MHFQLYTYDLILFVGAYYVCTYRYCYYCLHSLYIIMYANWFVEYHGASDTYIHSIHVCICILLYVYLLL